MTEQRAVHAEDHKAVDMGFFSRITRQYRAWVILGTVFGVLVSGVYLLVGSPSYTATAQVNVTPATTEPGGEARAPSNLIDMVAEQQIASSALTADRAAEQLGDGWSAHDLREGLEVTGDPSGTVLDISFTADDGNRASIGADGVAHAYLEVRADLAAKPATAMIATIDERISNYQEELQGLYELYYPTNADITRMEALQSEIVTLQQRRADWEDLGTQSGTVITPAHSNHIETSPIAWRVLALGLLAGLFLGVLLAALRHLFNRVAAHPADVTALINAPLLQPTAPTHNAKRWASAAILAHHDTDPSAPLTVLVDERSTDAIAAADALAKRETTIRCDLSGERGDVLDTIQQASDVVLIIPPTWQARDLAQLRDEITALGARITAVILAKKGN